MNTILNALFGAKPMTPTERKHAEALWQQELDECCEILRVEGQSPIVEQCQVCGLHNTDPAHPGDLCLTCSRSSAHYIDPYPEAAYGGDGPWNNYGGDGNGTQFTPLGEC